MINYYEVNKTTYNFVRMMASKKEAYKALEEAYRKSENIEEKMAIARLMREVK